MKQPPVAHLQQPSSWLPCIPPGWGAASPQCGHGPEKGTFSSHVGVGNLPLSPAGGSGQSHPAPRDPLPSHGRAIAEPSPSHCRAIAEPSLSRRRAIAEPSSSHHQAIAEPLPSHHQAITEPSLSHGQAIAEPWLSHRRAIAKPWLSHCQAIAEPSPCAHCFPAPRGAGITGAAAQQRRGA